MEYLKKTLLVILKVLVISRFEIIYNRSGN